MLPEYDFSERHEVTIEAPADVVRRAVGTWRPGASFPWRVLLTLRGMGAPRGTLREWAERENFVCLAEDERGVLYGLAGQFWRPGGGERWKTPRTPDEFRAFADARFALTAMSISAESVSPSTTRLATETRVRALSPAARRRFRLYWLIIRPFSGLLRREMLRGIGKEATRLARAG